MDDGKKFHRPYKDIFAIATIIALRGPTASCPRILATFLVRAAPSQKHPPPVLPHFPTSPLPFFISSFSLAPILLGWLQLANTMVTIGPRPPTAYDFQRRPYKMATSKQTTTGKTLSAPIEMPGRHRPPGSLCFTLVVRFATIGGCFLNH